MNGRASWAVIGVLAAVGLLAACDTGDGKQLQPVDPADTTSSTVPLDSIGGTADTLPSISGNLDDNSTPLPDEAESAAFKVVAPWLDGATIDARYTCDGLDIAPAVSWGASPSGTVEIAIVMVDESAVSNGAPFVHWAIAGIHPSEVTLIEGEVPDGATEAINFFGDIGYGGPCPPPGDGAHNYKLTVYALNNPVGITDITSATEFLDAIEPAVIEFTDLTGTFER